MKQSMLLCCLAHFGIVLTSSPPCAVDNSMEHEAKPQDSTTVDMTGETSEAKLARLEQEVHELEREVEEARDAAEDMTGRAAFAAQAMKDMHANPNGGHRLSGPSAHTLLEKSKAVSSTTRRK